jgi:hypothetical protein
MGKPAISPEERAELERLFDDLSRVADRTAAAFRDGRKVEAAAEDKKARDIVRRINEIQGA